MRTIMAKNPQDSSSFSRRYFQWKKKIAEHEEDEENEKTEQILEKEKKNRGSAQESPNATKLILFGLYKGPREKIRSHGGLKTGFGLLIGRARARSHFSSGLGSKVVGTLFGKRRGHVHFAIQEDFKLGPAFLVELATPTSVLVKEMASGLVRIALESDKRPEKKGSKLPEEPVWRTYYNGKEKTSF